MRITSALDSILLIDTAPYAKACKATITAKRNIIGLLLKHNMRDCVITMVSGYKTCRQCLWSYNLMLLYILLFFFLLLFIVVVGVIDIIIFIIITISIIISNIRRHINALIVETFFALVGDARLERIHLRMHAAHNAVALARLAVIRDADDEDGGQQYAGRCRHAAGEWQRHDETVRRPGQFQLADIVRCVTDMYLRANNDELQSCSVRDS